MDFDFTTETITPDATTVLTIGGSGALELPSGTAGQQPGNAAAGAMRWNTSVPQLEYYNGTLWLSFGGSVTSVQASGGSTGLSFSGGPITTSGTLTLAGTLGVANGGTGAVSFTTNGIVFGNGTSPLQVTSAGTQFQVLQAGSGGVPTFGAVNLAQAAAVTGILPPANGGTGVNNGTNTLTLGGNVTFAGSNPVTITTTGTTSVTLPTTGTLATVGNTVASFQTSLSGLTPSTATTGAVTLAGTLGATSGGTGTSTAPTSGQFLFSSGGTTYAPATLSSLAVTSFTAGSTGLTPNSATTGAISLSGTLNLASGGTNANLTANAGGVTYSTASALAISSAGTSGQVLVSGGTGAPTWTSAPTISGANITASTIPNSALANNTVTIGTTTIALGGTTTTLGGMTGITFVSGTITGVASPTVGSDVANKNYVDAAVQGLSWKQVVQAGTTTALPAVTYANGTAGVGATLTASANGALTLDGYAVQLNDRVLIKNQVAGLQNGIYTVTTLGTAGVPFVLTRSIDNDIASEMTNAAVYVAQGSTLADSGWVQNVDNVTMGTTSLVWQQFSGSGAYTAGAGLTLTGNTFSLTSPVAATLGGTGTSTAPSAGQLLVGTSGGAYAPFTVTSGTGISTTTGSGTFQINNTGVTSAVAGTGIGVSGATGAVTITNNGVLTAAGTTSQILVNGGTSATAGAITLSLPSTVSVANLTLTGVTANSFLYAGTGGALTTTTAPTNGQLLIGSTGAAPVAAALTAGTGISVTNGAGSITIANTGVITFSAGTTGLTPSSATAGAVTLAGTLVVANGGTGATTLAANGVLLGNGTSAVSATAVGTTGQVLVGNTASAPTWSTLTGIAVTQLAGTSNQVAVSASTGSVVLSLPSTVITPGSLQVGTSLQVSATNSITATGTNIGTAAFLTTDYNVVTTVASGTGVILPAGSPGRRVTVVNRGANPLAVYPVSGSIDGLGANVAITVPAGQVFEAEAISSTQWYTVDTVVVGGTAISVAETNGTLTISNTGVTSVSAGTGISVSGGTGAVTISNTGVTSVALAAPAIFSVTGSPITTTGTLTLALATQSANAVWAGPVSGAAATPTFRALVKADVINGTTGALQLYNENPSTPTQPTVAGTNAVAIGTGAAASGTNAFAVGSGSSASTYGARAYANGNFGTAGDAQAIHVVYRQSTSNNSAAEMFLDGSGASQRFVLPNNSAWTYTIRVIARRTDATGTLGSWIFNGMIYRDATAATTTLPNSSNSKTTLARVGNIAIANDPVVTADTTNGSLRINVTGVTGNTIRWVADCELVQVTN